MKVLKSMLICFFIIFGYNVTDISIYEAV